MELEKQFGLRLALKQGFFFREEILNEIPGLVEQLNLCMELSSSIEEIEDQLQDLHQQLALVKEAEAQGPKKHSLYKLPMLYDAYVKSQEAVNNAKKVRQRSRIYFHTPWKEQIECDVT